MHQKGKFPLEKITSGHLDVLQLIPEEDRLESITKMIEDDKNPKDVKVLWITWDRQYDEIHYKVQFDELMAGESVPKRKAMSQRWTIPQDD